MSNFSGTVNFIVGESKIRMWIAVRAFSSKFEELAEARKLCSQPGRGSSWKSDSDSWRSWGSRWRALLTKNLVSQGSSTWYTVDLPEKILYWFIFNFLLCKLSNIYKSRKKNTINSHVPITGLQLLSTHWPILLLLYFTYNGHMPIIWSKPQT